MTALKNTQNFDTEPSYVSRKLTTEREKENWRLACKTTSVTLSPVISGAPVQATSRNRPSQGSDDKSKDFYSYLRSSAHDHIEEAPDSSVRERTAKTDKSEKQTKKKADADPAIAAPTPTQPQTNQPAPPLSITALLGLPTAQKNDVTETG